MSRVRELADVRARREGLLVARDDDAVNCVVVVEVLECADELRHQLVRERVQRLRPIEPDDGDGFFALEEDGHSFRRRNFSTASRGSSVAIESASQSRAWLTVWCQERSRQKLSCCLV